MIPKPRHMQPTPTTFAALLVLFAALLVSLALTPRAEAFIYWTSTDDNSPDYGAIGRANLDGTYADDGFIPHTRSYNQQVAVDTNYIYWSGGARLSRANLDGSGVDESFIESGYAPGLAFDADHLYWTSEYADTVSRADLDGSNVDQSFITTAGHPWNVAVDAGHVYWVNGYYADTIGRADLDGTNVDQSFIDATDPVGLAVDANHVYWTDYRAGSIGRANVDGSGVDENFITTDNPWGIEFPKYPWDVEVDADHVYWTNTAGISRANLDGSNVDWRFIADGAGASIAVDALSDRTPPRTTITKGAPNKTDKSKVKFKFTSSEPRSTFECRLTKQMFRPCESAKTVKRLKRGRHRFQVRATDAAGNTDPTPAKDKFKIVG